MEDWKERALKAEAELAELQAQVQSLADAWLVHGKNPAYHFQQMNLLRRNWPTLFKSMVALTRRFRNVE